MPPSEDEILARGSFLSTARCCDHEDEGFCVPCVAAEFAKVASAERERCLTEIETVLDGKRACTMREMIKSLRTPPPDGKE